MRCPHCRGEIPPESQFCGVCGQNIHISQIGTPSQKGPVLSASDAELSASLFALPVSQGARRIRVGLILGINLLMVGAGIALLLGYFDKRAESAKVVVTGGDSANTASNSNSPTTPPAGTVVDAGASKTSGSTRSTNSPSTESDSARKRAVTNESETSPASGKTSKPDAGAAKNPAKPNRPTSPTEPRVPTNPQVSRTDAGVSQPPRPRSTDAGQGAATQDQTLTPEEQERHVQLVAGRIGLVVERHQSHLGRCYESALKQGNPKDPLQGRIDLHFSVQPNGTATGIRVRSNNTGSKVLASCLVGLVRSWTFPSSGSEALDFVWPFEFQAP